MQLSVRAAVMLLAGLAGIVCLSRASADDKALPDGDLARRVDRCVQAWQPVKEERRLDEIGWASDIRAALRLGKEHGRPIFLFSYSGSAIREHAMALQRC